MNSVYYLNIMNYFSAQTLTFCVFIVITCEQSKTDHFITFVCRIGGTTPIIQLKIKKRITRFFLVRVKPTCFWEMQINNFGLLQLFDLILSNHKQQTLRAPYLFSTKIKP